MTSRWVPGTFAALLVGVAAALPAAAQTPPPPPGTPISPPPTGVVLPAPPSTAPPPTEPAPVRAAPTTPPPTTATGSVTPSPSPTAPRAGPTPAPRPASPDPAGPAPPAAAGPEPSSLGPTAGAPARNASAEGGPRTAFVDTGEGLVALDAAPTPETPDPEPTTPDDAAGRTGAPPTQRRLSPDATADGDEVATPPTNGRATAATRRADRGLFRTELLPLLLLGGAVAFAYVACLQVAMRRREARTTTD